MAEINLRSFPPSTQDDTSTQKSSEQPSQTAKFSVNSVSQRIYQGTVNSRKMTTKQLSPVLQNKTSLKNIGYSKSTLRDSQDNFIKDAKANQKGTPSAADLKKKKYLNGNVTLN